MPYFDQMFHNVPRIHEALRASPLAGWRVPSRLVRYGLIHADTLKNALNDLIAAMEKYEENTTDGPTEQDDKKARA